jgi:hypothetical protein
MRTDFIIISSVLTLAAGVPYALDVVKRRTKPRVVTWLVWSILTIIAAAASFSDHQYASAILTLSESVETMAIVILGLVMGGIVAIAKFDIVCWFGALLGLILWRVLDSPSIAVLATVAIDLIGSLPTVKHMWEKPFEETWVTFALSTLSGLFTLMAAADLRITEIASPLDILVVNGAFVFIILSRRRSHVYVPAVLTVPSIGFRSPDIRVTPPAVPTRLVGASPTQIPSLTWQPVPGAQAYGIYRDGVKIGSTGATTYSDASAVNNTYAYHVTAVAAGQESGPSSHVSVVVDQTPPSLSFELSAQPNEVGWHNHPVTVTFNAHDDVAGVASCSPPVTLSADGARQTIVGYAMNYAGDSSSISTSVNIDQSPPTLGQPVWSVNPVVQGEAATLSVPVVDHLSGVAGGEYIGHDDPGAGKGLPLQFNGRELSISFDTQAAPGVHGIFVRARDAAGNWSAPVLTALEILPAPAVAATSQLPQPAESL